MDTSTRHSTPVAALIGTIAAFAIIIAATLIGIAAREPAYVFPFFFGLLVLDIAGSALVRSLHGCEFEERRIRSNVAVRQTGTNSVVDATAQEPQLQR